MLSKVLGGALGLSLVVIGFLWHNNGQLHEDLGTNKQALAQAVQTNKDNVAGFDRVNFELTACVDQTSVDKAANEVTVANLEASYARLEVRKNSAEIRYEEIFRDPNCAELRDLDIGSICPSWSDELRDRATSLGRNRDTRGPDSGT